MDLDRFIPQVRRVWRSPTLAAVPELWRPLYAWLRLAVPEGPFYFSAAEIQRRVFARLLPSVTRHQVSAMLRAFSRTGLFCSWPLAGETVGYFLPLDRVGNPVAPRRGERPPMRIIEGALARAKRAGAKAKVGRNTGGRA